MKLVYLEQGGYTCSTTWESADHVLADIGTGVRVLKSRKLRPGILLNYDDAVEHIALLVDELARTGAKISDRAAVLITGRRPAAQSTPPPGQVFVALRHTGAADTTYEVLVDKYGITPPHTLTAEEMLPCLVTLANGLQRLAGAGKAPAKAAAENAATVDTQVLKSRDRGLPGPAFAVPLTSALSCGFAAAAREMKAKAAQGVEKGEMMHEQDTKDKILETAERLQELITQAEEDEAKADEALFARVRAARAKLATAKREAETAKAADNKLLVETFRPVSDVLARLVDCPIPGGYSYGSTFEVSDTAAHFGTFRIEAVLAGSPGKARLRLVRHRMVRMNNKFDTIKADDAIDMIIRNAVELGIRLPGE